MTTPDGDLLAGLRNGSWLDRQDFPPLKYAVPGLIPEGTTLLVGPPKIGKSWFVLACALATAAGGVVLDKITVTARPTLYLALEQRHVSQMTTAGWRSWIPWRWRRRV